MKAKNFLVTGLAAAMLAAIALPSSAAKETTITGTFKDATYSVGVTNGSAQINPYSVPIEIDVGNDKKVELSAGQISTQPLLIVNNAKQEVAVSAKVYCAKPAGGMKLQTKALKTTSTAKEAYVYLEAKQSELSSSSDYKEGADTKTVIQGFDAETVVKAFADWKTGDDKAKQIVVQKKAQKAAEELVTLNKSTEKGSVGLLRLNGTCVKDPKKAWTKEDQFVVNIVWTFDAAEPETEESSTT